MLIRKNQKKSHGLITNGLPKFLNRMQSNLLSNFLSYVTKNFFQVIRIIFPVQHMTYTTVIFLLNLIILEPDAISITNPKLK